MAPASDPIFFASPAEFRRWLVRHAASAPEVSVGFMKRATGVPSLTWPQSVDEALCFGWIDGVRHRIDDERYRIRFTPRREGSHWSAVNMARMTELIAQGRVTPAGLAAFEKRREERTRRAAYEQPTRAELSADDVRAFRSERAAWRYFEAQPPGYRQRVTWWIVSAKRPETRARRLASLIEACRAQRRL